MDIQEDKDFAALPEVAKLYQACKERDLTIAEREYLKGARDAWQAAKAHEAEKLKGKVVVPNNQIEVWWQDAEEPENFATTIESMPALGENLGDKEIMEIDEHHTIHLPSKRIYGTWFEKDGEKCFATGTLEECRAMLEAARGGNE